MPSSRRGKFGRSRNPTLFFFSIVGLIVVIFCIEFALFNHVDISQEQNISSALSSRLMASNAAVDVHHTGLPAHLLPHVPITPLFNSISHAEDHIARLLDGQASMVGVIALLQKFISELHDRNQEASIADAEGQQVLEYSFHLTEKHLKPFDAAYRGKHIFPLREDGSIYISLAAFREPYLVGTLVSAFKNAKNPEKLFVGAVIQNCFGKILKDGTIDSSGTPCRGASMKVGENKKGRDIVKQAEVPVDMNGIEVFCAKPGYKQYCQNGQIRVLYVHHTDSQGPSMARYIASKLWGGENYFMQIDAHLRFAHEWDAKYIADAKLTLNYPKSILSCYPPGFGQKQFIPKRMGVDLSKVNNDTVIESPGTRLCNCGKPKNSKDHILSINLGRPYFGNETRPKQTAYIGAGFVFAHADFLVDVNFDPYLPWIFMGEEILLSMRAWTHGWNIYAPRKNLIIHHYRKGKDGIPKFYGSVNKMSKKFGYAWLTKRTIRRVKHLLGYPIHTADKIKADDMGLLLADIENYGLGPVRSWEDYLEFTQIKPNATDGGLDCPKRLDWCFNMLRE